MNHLLPISRLALMIFASLFLFCSASGQAPAESWRKAFDKELDWFRLTGAGLIVASTNDAIHGLDPVDGKVIWSNTEYRNTPEDFVDIVENTPFMTITRKGLFTKVDLVDVITGKTLWGTKDIGLAAVQGVMAVPDNQSLLIAGGNAKGKIVAVMVDMATGNALWTQEKWFGLGNSNTPPTLFQVRPDKKSSTKMTLKGNQPLLFLDENRFIAALSKDQLACYEVKTGNMIWAVDTKVLKGDFAPAIKNNYAGMILNEDKSVLYTGFGRNLFAVRTKDGTLVWAADNLPKLKKDAIPSQLMVTPKGLLVRSSGEKARIQLFDLTTGAEVWKKPFKDLGSCTNFLLAGDQIILYTNDKPRADASQVVGGFGVAGGLAAGIMRASKDGDKGDPGEFMQINLATGEAKKVATITFKGGDIPTLMTYENGLYLLRSEQNVMGVTATGEVKFHTYCRAPGASLFAKISTEALIAAANTMSYAEAQDRANRTNRAVQYQVINKNEAMTKRFKASQNSDQYVYMLTSIESGKKGVGIQQVNRLTGEKGKFILLGDKEPEYVVDEIEGLLHYQLEKKVLVSYKF